MKKTLFTILLGFSSLSSFAQTSTLAFPGAEGFGRYALGARASNTREIYHVTNLNNSGTGSLRDAISQPNRVIVFDVGGVIKIQERLIFSKNIYVAGQTAPGDGVTVYGNGVSFSSADNIIVRYMRFRMGSKGDTGKDAAGIANGKNMIFDHVSVSWGLDENFSINWDGKGTEPTNITIQNSIIGQGVMVHACGGLIQTTGGVTLFRNLYIDNKTRNPKVKGLNQFVNNVVYNWGSGGGYILGGDSEGPSWGVIEDNYFIKGPVTGETSAFVRGNENFQVRHKGNLLDYTTDGVLNGIAATDDVYGTVTLVAQQDTFANAPQIHPVINQATSAQEAYSWIVNNAGTILPTRDAVDNYMVDQLISLGTKGALINGESDLALPNGVGYVFNAPKALDTDNDGMPDTWEDNNSLNKNDASDATVIGSDGYMNIERYINGISAGTTFVKYPTVVAVKSLDTNYITVKWNNNTADATGIVLEKSIDNINFTAVATLEPTTTEYKVENLDANTTYYFRIKTVKGAMESMYSEVLKSTTFGVAAPPTMCTEPSPVNEALIADYTEATLSWANLTGLWGGDIYYNVFVGNTPDNLQQVATDITTKSYKLSLSQNTTYYWRVDTKNALGEQKGDVWSFTSGNKPEREKVAYWNFNETGGSSAANETIGYATAKDFTPTWTVGKSGNAISFPGTPASQAMVQSHYDLLNIGNQSFSFDLWFKSNGGTTTDWYLLHKGSHTANAATGATGRWFGLQYKSAKLTFGIDDNVVKTYIDIAASSYFNGQWNHVACVRDMAADKIQVYINGNLVGEKTDGTGDISEIEDLAIGNCNVNFNAPFAGDIDEVSIYNSALTAAEIKEKYNAGISTAIPTAPKANYELSTYPNPFTSELTLYSSLLGEKNVIVQIYNIAGQLVYNKSISAIDNKVTLSNLNTLSSGFYTCKIKTSDAEMSIKVLKNK